MAKPAKFNKLKHELSEKKNMKSPMMLVKAMKKMKAKHMGEKG